MKLNPRWLTGAALTLPSLAVYVWPNAMTALIWQRDALAEGQWWRLITAHFVHLNVRHLLWNLLGAWVICELFWDQLELPEGLMLCGASALGVSLLLWFCQPAFFWYAGLSGVLHGLWAGAAGAAWCRRPSLFFLVALILLLGKLAWPVGSIAGMAVASNAHRYGALTGLAWLACTEIRRFRLKYGAAKERCDRVPYSARLGWSTLQLRSRIFLFNFFKKRRA